MRWGVWLAFQLPFKVFLSRLQSKRNSAGVWVPEKYSPCQSVSVYPCPSVHILYLLVLQVYKTIFTSPSSAKDVSEEDNEENMPPAKVQKTSSSNKPVRRNVASKLHLNNKVTPRSIAYAAVQVDLFLLYVILCSSVTASSISTCKLRVHGPQFMEDSTTRDCTIMLSMFLRIPLGLLRRNVPKIYSTGGRCEYFLFAQGAFE